MTTKPTSKRTAPVLTQEERALWAEVNRKLRAYDAEVKRFRTDPRSTLSDLEACNVALSDLRNAFCAAAPQNSKDRADLIHPNDSDGWLRKVLHGMGFRSGMPKSERRARGWGW